MLKILAKPPLKRNDGQQLVLTAGSRGLRLSSRGRHAHADAGEPATQLGRAVRSHRAPRPRFVAIFRWPLSAWHGVWQTCHGIVRQGRLLGRLQCESLRSLPSQMFVRLAVDAFLETVPSAGAKHAQGGPNRSGL